MESQPRPGLTLLGKLVLFVFVVGLLYGAWVFLWPVVRGRFGQSAAGPQAEASPADRSPAFFGRAPEAEIGIAYGTEKQRWLEWAAAEFAKSDDGQRIKINLLPMGSFEGSQAILGGDQRIHAWSPASALVEQGFVQEWGVRRTGSPILRKEPLALTPMVFVMWAERHEAFRAKSGALGFDTVARALQEKSGWAGLAGKPEWGLFKFGHTHPNESNSGLMTIVLAAYSCICEVAATISFVKVISFTHLMQVHPYHPGTTKRTGAP